MQQLLATGSPFVCSERKQGGTKPRYEGNPMVFGLALPAPIVHILKLRDRKEEIPMIRPEEVGPADDMTFSFVKRIGAQATTRTMALPANMVTVDFVRELLTLDTPMVMSMHSKYASDDKYDCIIDDNPLAEEIAAVEKEAVDNEYCLEDQDDCEYVFFVEWCLVLESTIDPNAIAREYRKLAKTADDKDLNGLEYVTDHFPKKTIRPKYAHTYMRVCDPIDEAMPFIETIDESPELKSNLLATAFDKTNALVYASDSTFEIATVVAEQTDTLLKKLGNIDAVRTRRNVVIEFPMHIDELIAKIREAQRRMDNDTN